METLPAVSGWLWIKQGFALFRQQPGEMSALFVLYFFASGLISLIPVIGPILRIALTPVFAMAFMQACAHIQRGQRVYPKILFTGFHMPAFKSLMLLGMLYLLAAGLALLVTSAIDGGLLWQALNNPTVTPDVNDAHLAESTLLVIIVYLTLSLMLWYAAPLIAWQGMSVGKAIFFNFFAVKCSIKAFLVYLFAWATIIMFVSLTISILLSILTDNVAIGVLVLLPFVILLMLVMQCSFYPSYTQIFGIPQFVEKA